MKDSKIIKAEYIKDYKIKVTFADGVVKIADFENFITNSDVPMTNQFKDKERFKKVCIDCGHLTWENGQMDIASWSVYNGRYDVKD